LVVSDQKPTNINIIRTVAGITGTVVSQDLDSDSNNDDFLIIGSTTINGVANQEYRIHLLNYNTALTADDFLIMTEAETEAYIATFDAAGADIL
jgi:hypothetical protein